MNLNSMPMMLSHNIFDSREDSVKEEDEFNINNNKI